VPLNPSWLVYDGSVTRWGDGSAGAPVLLPALQEVSAGLIQFNVGTLASGQLAKTAGLPVTIANNLAGGAAGEVVYQIGLNQTGFTAVGSSAQLLQSNGAGAPTWIGANNLAVTATGSTTARTLANRFDDVVNVLDFGADPTGGTDSTQAFVSCAATNKPFVVPNGNYVISSPITFNYQVTLFPNAKLITSANLVFANGFEAPLEQAFSGTGTISFNESETQVAYPEWWGAIPNDNTQDCTSAIQKAYAACPVLQLQAADYWINGGLVFTTNNRKIKGVSQDYTSGSVNTRIVSKSNSADIIFVGYLTEPVGGIPNFVQNVSIYNVQVTRSVAPLISSNCKGFRFQYLQYGYFELLKSTESMVGMYFGGTVLIKANDIDCGRVQSGTGAGTNYFQAFYIDGSVNIGTSGGNASLYLTRAKGECANASINSTGVLCNANFSDVWLFQPEMGNFTIGMDIIGNNNTSSIVDTGNVDITILNPVIDQFLTIGISITNVSQFGSLKVIGGYASPAVSSGSLVACFYVNNSNGIVSWIEGDFVFVGSNCYGSYLNNSKGVVSNNRMLESAGAGTYLVNCKNCIITDWIINESVASAVSAIILSASSFNQLNPSIYGSSIQKRPYGVFLNSTSTKNYISVSGIDGTSIGGKGNAVNVNGTLVTSAGYYNTNLVDGVF